MTDERALHDRALDLAAALVSGVPAGGWDAATPCREWTVAQLVEHLGWGNAVLGRALSGAPWVEPGRDRRVALPPPRDLSYHATVAAVRAQLGRAGALDRPLDFPAGPLPAAAALGIRVQDVVVHCWDLAVATGQPLRLADDLLRSAARTIAGRRAAGALPPDQFAPARLPSGRPSALNRLLAAAGRDERWTREDATAQRHFRKATFPSVRRSVPPE